MRCEQCTFRRHCRLPYRISPHHRWCHAGVGHWIAVQHALGYQGDPRCAGARKLSSVARARRSSYSDIPSTALPYASAGFSPAAWMIPIRCFPWFSHLRNRRTRECRSLKARKRSRLLRRALGASLGCPGAKSTPKLSDALVMVPAGSPRRRSCTAKAAANDGLLATVIAFDSEIWFPRL